MNREAGAVDCSGLTDCAFCGSGAVEVVADPIEVQYKGDTYTVEGVQRERCTKCGEEFFAPGQMDEVLRIAASMARERKGLLSPTEIQQIRAELNLRQTDLEALLGVGPKSVTRWEKGTVVQSAAVDRIMRMLRQEPDTVRRLLQKIDARTAEPGIPVAAQLLPCVQTPILSTDAFTSWTFVSLPVAPIDTGVSVNGVEVEFAAAA